MADYTYTIATDTANGEVSLTKLNAEIEASSVGRALGYHSVRFSEVGAFSGLGSDEIVVTYDSALSPANKSILDGIIASHDGVEPAASDENLVGVDQDLGGKALLNVGTINGVDFDNFATNTNTHVGRTDNPHDTSIANIQSGTLAELNSKVTDATLDDSGDPRDPNSHAATHSALGSDPISHNDLADLSVGDPHTQYYNLGRITTWLSSRTTDELSEGVTNKYYTEARVDANTNVAANTNHRGRTDNPHNTSLANLDPGSLADLNALVTDATLDDVGDPRTPTAHAATHYVGGSDPLEVQSLSSGPAPGNQVLQTDGLGGWTLVSAPVVITDHGSLSGLGDDDHPQYTRVDGTRAFTGNVNLGGNAITNVSTVDGVDVSDLATTTNLHIADTGNPHSTSIANIQSGTLAELNSKVTDATLDDSGDPRDPNSHAATHSALGSDPISHNDLADLAVGDPHTQYLNSARFDTEFAGKTTDDLDEGVSNFYYTEARVSANADVSANSAHRLIVSGNPHGTTAADVGAIPTTEKGAANGVATLDAGGKIPTAQIPASALPEFDVVADIAARDALTPQEGDEAFVQSNGKFYIYDGSSWFERPSNPDQVSNGGTSTDNALARFDGTTGKVIQNSGIIVDDTNNLTVPGDIAVSGTVDGVNVSLLNSQATTHIAQQNNPHNTDLANLGSGTLADLNALVTDATLDDAGDPRTPTLHASTHEQGGSDELIVQNLGSGAAPGNQILQTDGLGGWTLISTPVVITDHGSLSGLGDDDHPQYVLANGARAFSGNIDAGGNDLVNVALVDGVDVSVLETTTNAHISNTGNPHGTDIGNLGAGTLAELNALVTDATLDDIGQPRTPTLHASTHEQGGSDELIVQNLGSGAAPSGRVLESDGLGGWSLVPTPSPVTDHGALTGLGDDDHPQYLRTDGGRALTSNLDVGGNNVTNVGTVDGVDVSAQASTTNAHISNTNNPHGTDLANLGSGTLAELNSKVTDATLDDIGQPRTPTLHASTHEQGGSDELIAQNLGSGIAVSDQVMVTDGLGGWTLQDKNVSQNLRSFSGVSTVNGPTLSSSFSPVDLGAQNIITSGFTHVPGTAEVTITETGRYAIQGHVSTENFDSNGRTDSEMRVSLNSGGGFNAIPGMTGSMYNRNSNQGRTNAAVSTVLDLNAGDILRLEARRRSGTNDIRTLADQCGLTIHAVRGVQGPQGPQGPPGTTLAVEEEGSALGNFDTINFQGDFVTATDAGAGQVNVEVAPPSLDDQKAFNTNLAATGSGTATLIPDMFLTANKTGSYLVTFECQFSLSTNGAASTFDLRLNGVLIADTERTIECVAFVGANVERTVSISTLVTLNAGDQITATYRVNFGTVDVQNRTLLLLERR